MIYNEIEDIEKEIREKDLDASVSAMVDNWNEDRNNKDPEKEEIRNFVSSSLAGRPEKRPTGRVFIRYALPAAAVIAGAIFMINILSPKSPDELFANYYEPFNAVPEVTRGTEDERAFSNGIESYRNGKYMEASVAFTEILRQDPTSVQAQFFLGITAVASGEFDKAAGVLRQVAVAGGGYSKEAKWYLALALLRTGDTEGVKENLKTLAESPGYYSERAAALLRSLE